MPDSILNAIDNAVRDYGTSPDAMRWTPEPPEEHAPDPMLPTARIEKIEIRVKTSDGVERTYTMAGAREASVSLEWEDPFRDPWDIFSTSQLASSRCLESFTLAVEYPQDLRGTHRTG